MESWPEFRPTRLLERLGAHRVDFVVVGGFAAIAHGSARLTNDLDVTYASDAPNLQALGEALVEAGARMHGVADDVSFTPDAQTLKRTTILTLDTDDGPIDLLREPPGAPSYATLRRRAERIELSGVTVLVASLEDLMEMKRTAGRPKDRLDLEELEAIRRLRRRA